MSGGLGRLGWSLVKSIIAEGGKVVVADVQDGIAVDKMKDLPRNSALYVSTDVTKKEQIVNAIDQARKKFGGFNAAVHCAYPTSAGWGTSFEDLEVENLALDLTNQLGGTILFAQQVIRYFVENGGGSLVQISSILGVSAPKFWHYTGTNVTSPIEYGAIKAGVISITKYLAKYYAKQNIRVNCVSPGGILDNQAKEFVERYESSCTSKGLLNSDDVTGIVLFLLSEHSKYINGQNIIIDDGWSL